MSRRKPKKTGPAKRIPKRFKAILFLLGFIILQQLTYRATAGFQITHIGTPSSITEFEKEYSNAPMPDGVRELLRQPFHFLGRGSQSYAFVSEDGQYVLKVFQQHHFLIPSFLKSWPLPKLAHDFARSQEIKREKFMKSVAIAATHWKEETGTLYAHLASSDELEFSLTFIDKLNIAHQVPADTLQFAVQRKADLVTPTLKSLLNSGNQGAAETCVRSLISLIKNRSENGIGDRDPVVRRNFGFIGLQAIELDIGSYYENDCLKEEPLHGRAVFFEIKNLHSWLKKHFPELAPVAEKELAPYLTETT